LTIKQDIQSLSPGALIELYAFDPTALGGSLTYFHAGTNGLRASIVWQGVTYNPWPVEASGFEFSGRGQLPTPHIKLANIGGLASALVVAYGDLVGAKITRKRTFAKYIDAVNFPAGYLAATTASASTASTPHATNQNIGTKRLQEWTARARCANWGVAADYATFLSKDDNTGVREFAFYLNGPGASLSILVQQATGGVTYYSSTVAVPFTNNLFYWMKAVRNRDFGTITFYTSAQNVQTAGEVTTWVQLGTPVACTNSDVTASSVSAMVGSSVNLAYAKRAVDVSYSQFKADGTTGVLEFYAAQAAHGATALTARTGEAWTITSPATLAGGNANADPSAGFPDDVFYVERKVAESRLAIEWALASAIDVEGVQLPGRQVIANVCTSVYRSAECSYAGGAVATAEDIATGTLGLDVCGKRLTSCRMRFPQPAALPYGGFPSAGKL
jgi:phage-related protein